MATVVESPEDGRRTTPAGHTTLGTCTGHKFNSPAQIRSLFHTAIILPMPAKMDQPTSATDSQTAPRDANLAGVAPKAIIKNVDMTEEMQQESVDIASAALEKYNIEKDIAAQIKKEFDRRHGPTWHVVVGKNFGSYVTHGMSSLPFPRPSRPRTRR